MSKLDELRKLRNELDIEIKNKENYPKDYPSVIITNHDCLKDIFYVLTAFDDDVISLISARIVYKKDYDRLKEVNKYLNAFPIEAHGGKIYSDMCLKYSSEFLKKGISLSIFPEGAYIPGKNYVHKGRTGAARILFDSMNQGSFAYFLPVSIDVISDSDIDSYKSESNDKVKINVLEPIDPREYYNNFINSNEKDANDILHSITDKGIKEISKSLNRKYIDEYIELYPKGNVIFSNGETVDTKEAQKEEYISKYNNELKSLSLKLENIKK